LRPGLLSPLKSPPTTDVKIGKVFHGKRKAEEFDAWLGEAERSGVAEMKVSAGEFGGDLGRVPSDVKGY